MRVSYGFDKVNTLNFGTDAVFYCQCTTGTNFVFIVRLLLFCYLFNFTLFLKYIESRLQVGKSYHLKLVLVLQGVWSLS